MTQGLINDETLQEIAAAIREMTFSETAYYPSDMPEAIRSIKTGSNVTMEDNPTGGVDLTVNEETRTLAKYSELPSMGDFLAKNNPEGTGHLILGTNNKIVNGTRTQDTNSVVTGSNNAITNPAYGQAENYLGGTNSFMTNATLSFSHGDRLVTTGDVNTNFGFYNTMDGQAPHSFIAGGRYNRTTKSSCGNVSGGWQNTAAQFCAHAEGEKTVAAGRGAHSEGGTSEGYVAELSSVNGSSTLKVYKDVKIDSITVVGYGAILPNTPIRTMVSTKFNVVEEVFKPGSYITGTPAETKLYGPAYVLPTNGNSITIPFSPSLVPLVDAEINMSELSNLLDVRPYNTDKITAAIGEFSHAEGRNGVATGAYAHAENFKTRATGQSTHAEGEQTTASGTGAHAEGLKTTASGNSAHAEGEESVATAEYAHAEGYRTQALNYGSHAEGQYTKAVGIGAHAEGGFIHKEGDGGAAFYVTDIVNGRKQGNKYIIESDVSYIELKVKLGISDSIISSFKVDANAFMGGSTFYSLEDDSVVDGDGFQVLEDTIIKNGSTIKLKRASGKNFISNTYLTFTTAIGGGNENYELTENIINTANGDYSHVGGVGNIANSYQHVSGRLNKIENDKIIVIGNGKINPFGATDTEKVERSNAYTLDWDGNGWFAGKVSADGTPENDNDLVPLSFLKSCFEWDDTTQTLNLNLPWLEV